MKNSILHLVLKAKWFDMIACGEKREEYREVSHYWAVRLLASDIKTIDGSLPIKPADNAIWQSDKTAMGIKEWLDKKFGFSKVLYFKPYKKVCFHRGYSDTVRTFTIESITIGKGKTEWGAPSEKEVFIIKFKHNGKRV